MFTVVSYIFTLNSDKDGYNFRWVEGYRYVFVVTRPHLLLSGDNTVLLFTLVALNGFTKFFLISTCFVMFRLDLYPVISDNIMKIVSVYSNLQDNNEG